MVETMTLWNDGRQWMMRSTSEAVASLLGTDTLPTAYLSGCSAEHVEREIRRLNPDAVVVMNIN